MPDLQRSFIEHRPGPPGATGDSVQDRSSKILLLAATFAVGLASYQAAPGERR